LFPIFPAAAAVDFTQLLNFHFLPFRAATLRCNATTETQDSRCQTAIINAVDDFCLW
jgi:hypothetical protein